MLPALGRPADWEPVGNHNPTTSTARTGGLLVYTIISTWERTRRLGSGTIIRSRGHTDTGEVGLPISLGHCHKLFCLPRGPAYTSRPGKWLQDFTNSPSYLQRFGIPSGSSPFRSRGCSTSIPHRQTKRLQRGRACVSQMKALSDRLPHRLCAENLVPSSCITTSP